MADPLTDLGYANPGPAPTDQGPSGEVRLRLRAVFRVRWDLARTAPNQTAGLHWREQARRKAALRLAVRSAWNESACFRLDPPVPVLYDLHVFRATGMDDDNLAAAFKFGRDRLFRLCGLPDDSPRWVQSGQVHQIPRLVYAGREYFVVLVYTDD